MRDALALLIVPLAFLAGVIVTYQHGLEGMLP